MNDAGFTLIEAMVAMAVLAVASAGLIGVAERHVDLVRATEARTAARWVAENRLAELRVLPAATLPRMVPMLGRTWRVDTIERPAADPDIAAVEVRVGDATGTLVSLRGFRDLQGETR